jgi:cellulose synthase operon protein C
LSTFRTGALALATCLFLAACGGASAPELVAKAKEALAAKDAKAAQIHLKNALQQDANLAEARFLLGRVLLDGGDVKGALVELDKAEQAGFRASELAPVYARALLEFRESRKLVDKYGSVKLDDPSAQAELMVYLSRAQGRLDKREEALATLQQALAVKPGHPMAEVELARATADAGDMQGAMERVDGLIAKSPTAEAWRLKGDLEAVFRKDLAAARKAYEKAVETDPKSTEARLTLIGHLVSVRELNAAEEAVKQAKAAVGQPPMLRYYAAVVEMERGRLDTAYEQVEQLQKLAPEEPRIALLAGQIEFLRNRFQQAEVQLTRAVAHAGNSAAPRMLLAQTYLRLQDPARALQTLQPLLEQGGKNARVQALAGEASMMLGETRRAEEYFKSAAELDPNDARSRTLSAVGKLTSNRTEARGLAELRDLSENFESPVADLALVHTFLRKGDVKSALEAIDAIDKKEPGKGIAPLLRSQVLRAQGKAAEADAQLVEALKRDPKYLPAALFQARQDLAAKQPAKAVERVAAVVKADPGNVVTQLAWFNLRQQAGEPLEPIEKELAELVKRQPQVARARQALVQLQLRRGRLAEAAASAQQAVSALPTEASLVEQLADVQLRQREFVLAAKTLEQLADLRPSAPEPLLRLAELERLRERPRDAMAAVKKAIALRANHPAALRMQIVLEAELGNVEQARRLAKDMGALPGLEAAAAAAEGDLESQQQQYGVAESAYRRALARSAALPDVPAKLMRTLYAAGKKAEAETFAKEWLRDHPADVSLMNFMGDHALNLRDFPTARAHYEKSLAVSNAQPLVLNNLAWLSQQQGDLKRAEQFARDALRSAPGEPALLDTLSGVLSAAGQHEPALAAQREALQKDSNPVYRVALARRLIAAGQKDAARDELQVVQQLGERYPGQAEVAELLSKV